MKMNDTVARIVEIMFQDVEMNEETAAIRDEVMNNCQERFNDMLTSGISEDDAITAVIESLKGMDDVLAPYKKKPSEDDDELDDDMDNDESSSVQHVIFAANAVHSIDVTLSSEDVNIEASDDEDYHVKWDTNENTRLKVELQDGELCISRDAGTEPKVKKEQFDIPKEDMVDFVKTEDGKIEIDMNGIGRAVKSLGEKIKLQFTNGLKIDFGRTWGAVIIQVPENAMPHVKLLTTSGDIDVQDVTLSDLDATTTSGDINLDVDEDQRLAFIEMHTTSGDIEVSAYADRASIASTSGDVDVEGQYNKLSIGTISGDMDVRADVMDMNFSAISGDVDLQFDSDVIRKVRGSTVSGDIEIELPDGLGMMGIGTQTRSGDVITRYVANGVGPAVTGGVSSMSGDITIR